MMKKFGLLFLWLCRIITGIAGLWVYPFLVFIDRTIFSDLYAPGLTGWGQSSAFVWRVWQERFWSREVAA